MIPDIESLHLFMSVYNTFACFCLFVQMISVNILKKKSLIFSNKKKAIIYSRMYDTMICLFLINLFVYSDDKREYSHKKLLVFRNNKTRIGNFFACMIPDIESLYLS